MTSTTYTTGLMIALWSNREYQVVAWSPLDSQLDNPYQLLTRFFTDQETCEILEVYHTAPDTGYINQRCEYWRKQLGVD
jgi:hypothetical protein